MIGETDSIPVPQPDAAADSVAAEPLAGAIETARTPPQVEIDGRDGPDPTRYGDWEKNGRCIDF